MAMRERPSPSDAVIPSTSQVPGNIVGSGLRLPGMLVGRIPSVTTGTDPRMVLEPHATAAGAGHPPADEPPPGALVNLAETVVVKEENVFVVSRRDGSLPVGASHPLGINTIDCLFLSGHELCINGVRPRLLVASSSLGSESVHELTNPALPLPGGRILPLQTLQIRLIRRILTEGGVEETVFVQSHDREPLYLDLEVLLETDFEPMLAIRGIVATGPAMPVGFELWEYGGRLTHRGRDGRHRATTIEADRPCEPGDAP